LHVLNFKLVNFFEKLNCLGFKVEKHGRYLHVAQGEKNCRETISAHSGNESASAQRVASKTCRPEIRSVSHLQLSVFLYIFLSKRQILLGARAIAEKLLTTIDTALVTPPNRKHFHKFQIVAIFLAPRSKAAIMKSVEREPEKPRYTREEARALVQGYNRSKFAAFFEKRN
jgi:hypothetical protein